MLENFQLKQIRTALAIASLLKRTLVSETSLFDTSFLHASWFHVLDCGGKWAYLVEASHSTWYAPTPLTSLIWLVQRFNLPDFKDYYYYLITFFECSVPSLLNTNQQNFHDGKDRGIMVIGEKLDIEHLRALDACFQLRQNHHISFIFYYFWR